MNKFQARCAMVLHRLGEMVLDDELDAESLAVDLEFFLNELAEQDAFGTEKQSDPRGDFRNGSWSMQHVEGIDD